MINLKKKEGESSNAFIYRFNKKVKHSGVMKEVRKRRFKDKPINKNKRKASALYRAKKQEEIKEQKKYGGEFGKRNTR